MPDLPNDSNIGDADDQYPDDLLTPPQELAYGRAIEIGKHITDIAHDPAVPQSARPILADPSLPIDADLVSVTLLHQLAATLDTALAELGVPQPDSLDGAIASYAIPHSLATARPDSHEAHAFRIIRYASGALALLHPQLAREADDFARIISDRYNQPLDIHALTQYPNNLRETVSSLSEFLEQHYRNMLERATEARHRLVIHNHRLARSQIPATSNAGEDREGLVQEALLALFQAANRYDHRRGNRFSTYAIWWIRQYVKRATDNLHRSIHLPNNVHDDARRLYRFQLELEASLSRAPTDDELAAATGMTVPRIHEVFQLTQMDLSLDIPQPTDASALSPMELPDQATPSPHEETVNRQIVSSIAGALSSLSPREQDIISRRFGLGYPSPQDYAEIAAAHSLSRQRAQQIATSALAVLRLDPQAVEAYRVLS